MKLLFKAYKLMLLPLLVMAQQSFADNGYYPFAFASQAGVGGAGAALPIEANNVESNPALLGQMYSHLSAFAGFQHVTAELDTSAAPIGNPAAGNQHNSLVWRPFGLIGFCMRPNERWAFGFGNAGGIVLIKYDQSITAGGDPKQNRQYKQTFALINPTVAYNFSCNQSYGFSLLVAASQLKTDVQGTRGNAIASYTLGLGVRIGGFWTLTDWLNIGASLSSPVYFQKNDRYSDVLKHHLNLPAIARIGFDFHCGDSTHLLVDFKEIFYGEVDAQTDLGWENQFVFMIGLRQQITCKLVGSIGYNYGKSPYGSENVFLNGLNMDFIEHHFAAGIVYSLNDNMDIFLNGFITPKTRRTDNGNGILGADARGAFAKTQAIGANMGIVMRF